MTGVAAFAYPVRADPIRAHGVDSINKQNILAAAAPIEHGHGEAERT
jgi:hypothetical protein